MPGEVLVTGGAGFVGSNLCAALLERGYSPVAIDDLSNGIRENVPDGVPLVLADLSDKDAFKALSSHKFSAVLHLAAQSSNAISFRDPQRDLLTNQLSTLNLLDFCRDREIKRVMFTSSVSAYGQPETVPTPESEPCLPGSFYGAHKLASEHYLRIWGETYGLDWTVFRLFTTYGVGQNMANVEQGLIKIYLGYVLRNEPLLVRGAGSRLRDCVHVTDVIEAFMLALENPVTYGRCYNVATGIALRVDRIIEIILEEAGYEPGKYPVTFTDAGPGDPHTTHGDISALARDLGWRPRVSPEDGIRSTVRGYVGGRGADRPKG